MKAAAIIALFLSFSVVTFLGCAGISKDPSIGAGLLEPSSIQKFTDVPVPMGFKLLPTNSYSFESAGVRVGVLKYRGKASPDQIVNFYKEQMPMYNWNLLNVVEYGDRQMNFDRENETCVINIIPKGSSATIVASVGPKSQTPKKPAKPVK
jgi:hypothetical protein